MIFRNASQTTLADAKKKIAELDRAEERPVYVEKDPVAAENPIGDRMEKMPGYKGIFNKDTVRSINPDGTIVKGRHVSIVTNQYTLIEHSEAFEPCVEALEREGIKSMYARYEQTPRYANVVYMIDDQRFVIKPKDGVPIWIGYRMSNGYDGTRAVDYRAWLMRADETGEPDHSFAVSVPKDGKVANSVNIAHRGNKEIVIDAVQDYVKKVDEYGKAVTAKINSAIDVPVDEDMVGWVLRAVGYGPKGASVVKQEYDVLPDAEKGTAWGVCIAIARASRDYGIERTGNKPSERIDKILRYTADVLDKAEEMMLEDEAKARVKAAIPVPAK